MPLGPFKVEFIRVDETIPQRTGYTSKARLLNAPKQHNIPVAGISYRQQNAEIAIRTLKKANRSLDKRAELIYENTNVHDPLAVAVFIFGYHVGYLPRALCKEYRDALSYVIPEGLSHIPMFCPFLFIGGGPDVNIGVRLALPKSQRASEVFKKSTRAPKPTKVESDPKVVEKV